MEALGHKGVEAVAISFLWSFNNPDHEQKVKKRIQEKYPQFFISASSDICPMFGEYERTSTTVINSFVGPLLARYGKLLEEELKKRGLAVKPLIMKSDGGTAYIDEAVEKAVLTLYSGPAAGVIGALDIGERLKCKNLICFDMGGTSTDVGIIYDGRAIETQSTKINRQPVLTPMININSVGAGGGSIAWVDPGKVLKVGPMSAGAEPGPACYGKGGTEPTVTDADILLGYINPDYFLGGKIRLNRNLAEKAIRVPG